jgi:ligand-binding sensor domain-containing protein/signal transduction histidine kinase
MRLWFSGLLLVSSVLANARQSDASFQRITINDGLSLSSVYCIYQDRVGYMWFATEDGLNKYDGTNFTIYNHSPGESNSLTYRWIERIVEDSNGNLWLGSRHGLSRLDPATGEIVQYLKNSDRDHHIVNDTILSMDVSGNHLWVGTRQGLSVVNTRTGTASQVHLDCPPELQVIHTIHVDNKQRVWIGAEAGLFIGQPEKAAARCLIPASDANGLTGIRALLVDGDTLWIGDQSSLVRAELGVGDEPSITTRRLCASPGEAVNRIFKDSGNTLWLVTPGAVLTYDHDKPEMILETPDLSPSLAINPQKPIIEDQQNNIWLGTFGDGVYKISNGGSEISHFTHDPANLESLSDNTVNSLFEDRAGGIWIGTFGAGISIYYPGLNLIQTLRHSAYSDESMSSNFVWSILETNDKKLWIGTNTTGIDVYDPETGVFQNFRHEPGREGSLQEGDVREIYQDSRGKIWIGTNGGGLSMYDPAAHSFRKFRHDPEDEQTISSNSVRTVYEDTGGAIWIGTRNGLNKLNRKTGQFRRYLNDPNNPSSISNSFVYSSIHMDKKGFLWIGTYGGGLNRLDPETESFISFRFDPQDTTSISDDIVFSIYEDDSALFWIGTNSGLNRFDPSTGVFRRFGLNDGLPNEVIYGIMPDENGFLWLTTNKGISRFDPEKTVFKNFDVTDGLQSNEFNGGAFHKGWSGLIYAGGVYGLNIIDPEKILPVPNNAIIIINRFEVPGKESGEQLPRHIAYQNAIELNYKERFFSIEFAALNHVISEKLDYCYRMKNLDDRWSVAGQRNYVTYANMRPGKYTFEVNARNSDGYLSSYPAEMDIYISPPFWGTLLFKVLMGLILAGIAIFIYRFLLNQRTNKLLRSQNEQIRSANNQLSVSEENLKKLNATKDKFFSIISHDLKNPFASVLSISEQMDCHFDTTEMGELKYGINKIHKTNQHIYNLLENLLLWSRTQRNKITINTGTFNLSKTIEIDINVLRLSAEKKGISINNCADDDIMATGDREMISTVFRNLLNNAIKFTPTNRKVTVRSAVENSFVWISIEDEGIGIDTHNLEKIFDIEEKFQTDGTDGEKGTGLGLIICKEFIEMNSGKIEVNSIPGQGSVFSFSLPAG